MIFLKENENTIINRVWIVKKSISYSDARVGGVLYRGLTVIPNSTQMLCFLRVKMAVDGLTEKEILELLKNQRLCLEIKRSLNENPQRILLTRTT